MVAHMRASLDWAGGGGAAKYGNVNTTAMTTMGQSCSGLEAMSTAYHDDRVKRIVMLNLAIFQDERRYLRQEIKVPVAYFVGGPQRHGVPQCKQPVLHATSAGGEDSADKKQAEKDYKLLNVGGHAYKAHPDTDHSGTYAATNGGKVRKGRRRVP